MHAFARIAAIVLLALAARAEAASYYAATTGSPAGDGSLANPWDLPTALSHPPSVVAGDTIWVRGGTYAGAHTSLLAGAAGNPITVRAYRRERVVLDYASNGNCNPSLPNDCTASNRRCNALTIPACSHDVTFRDLEVMSSEPAGRVSLPAGGCASAPSCCYVDGVGPPLKPECSEAPSAIARAQWNPVVVLGSGVKLVNLTVHDGGTGIATDHFAADTEIYGALSFNNGWVDPIAGHGHGAILENASPSWQPSRKVLRDSVLWNNFGEGSHTSPGWGTLANNLLLDEVVAFNNGAPAAAFYGTAPSAYPAGQGVRYPNLVLEAKETANLEIIRACRSYQPLTSLPMPNRIGSSDFFDVGNTAGDVVIEDSYLAGAGTPLRLERIDTLRLTGNTIVGGGTIAAGDQESLVHFVKRACLVALEPWWFPEYAYVVDGNSYFFSGEGSTPFVFENDSAQYRTFQGWKASLQNNRESTSTYAPGLPSTNAVFVQPNVYEPGRAHVVIYNWLGLSSVSVDLSSVGLAEGQQFKVYNLQAFDNAATVDWFGTVVASGTFHAAAPSVSIPMTDTTVTAPLGLSVAVASTLPEFGAFLVRGTPCGDGVIDAGETCDDGDRDSGDGCDATCAPEPCWTCSGTPSACSPVTAGTSCANDGNNCTDDVCDGAGACTHPSNTAPCDDGVFCNGADVCSGGSCGGHAGDPCAVLGTCRSCDEVSDSCTFAPAGSPCSTPDANVCTDDACDGTGSCAHTNNTAPCDDGLFCNGADTCSGGACAHAGDPCASGGECANACNEARDTCFDPLGTPCAGDANVCTDDVCDGAGACGRPNTSPCDDGDACTSSDACSGGSCQGVSTAVCGDGDICGGEACDDGNTARGDGCSARCQIEAPLDDDGEHCVNDVNRRGAGVAKAQDKLAASCLKKEASDAAGNAQACLGLDAAGGVRKAKDKTIATAASKCAAPPAFGFTSAAAVNGAAAAEEIALVADLFGPVLDAAVISKDSDRAGAACQQAILGAVHKLALTKLNLFRACKKAGLAGRKTPQMLSGADLETCFDVLAADAAGKIAKAAARIAKTLLTKCAGIDLGATFPGSCPSAGFAACLEARVECRVCRLFNAMDALEEDCDAFDDGTANASCP